MSKTYHCAVYLRLSKEDEDITAHAKQQSSSIQNQKAYIEEFLRDKPAIQVTECYIDDGYSGTDFDRPAFQKMLQDIHEKKIDCVIVKDLSRLGRNYIEAGKYIERLFPFLGVRFIAVNDNYDSIDDTAESNHIIIPFKNLINDAYCRDISIKIRSHLEIKRKKGEFIGAFAVYGYMRGKEKSKLTVDEFAADIVKQIFQMKMSGMSPQGIADELNGAGVLSPAEYKKEQGSGYKAAFQKNSKAKWTAVSVRRILSNEIYTGTLIQGKESTPNYKVKRRERIPSKDWIRVENTHEPIINRSEFDVIQEIMRRDTRISEGKKTVALYSGYLTCADCGCSMVRKKAYSGNTQYVYYVCSGNKKNKECCSSHRISEVKLNRAVGKTLQVHIRYLTDVHRCIQSIGKAAGHSDKAGIFNRQIKKNREEIEKNQHLKLKCYEDYKGGLITADEYLFFKTELENRIVEAGKAVKLLSEKSQLLMQSEMGGKTWIEEFLDSQSTELTREELVQLVCRIYVYENQRIEIVFRYQDEIERIPVPTG